MIIDPNSRRPEIEYPCDWHYKVIGKDVDRMLSAIEEAAGSTGFQITPSNVSKNEKYYSLNVQVAVDSEIERDIIYNKLSASEDVIMVL